MTETAATGKASDQPERQAPGGPPFVVALGLLAAMSATAVDIVLPATPAIETDFRVGAEAAQLVITAYIAGMSIGLIPIGLLADRIGRRPVCIACITCFILAGTLTLAPLSFPMLLALRFIQGLCGAVGPSLSRAIVRDLDGPDSGARLMAVITAILSLAPLVGPLLGGVLTQGLGWRAPFWSSALYGLATLIAVMIWMPETRRLLPKRSFADQIREALSSIIASPKAKTGMALFALPFVGYFAFLTSLSTVMHDLYHVSAARFGLLFALSATSYFIGAMLARHLLNIWSGLRVLHLGAAILGATGIAILLLALMPLPPGWALWAVAASYMLGMAICLPITTMTALRPLARSAGLGAALLGTFQIGIGAIGSFASAHFYDGSHRSLCWVAAIATISFASIYVLRLGTLRSAE